MRLLLPSTWNPAVLPDEGELVAWSTGVAESAERIAGLDTFAVSDRRTVQEPVEALPRRISGIGYIVVG